MKHAIRVVDSGELFRCGEEQHLLQGMQCASLDDCLMPCIPVGCRGGGCGVCRIEVIEGEFVTRKMSRKHIPLEEQERGRVLACRILPRSSLLIRVLGPSEPESCL